MRRRAWIAALAVVALGRGAAAAARVVVIDDADRTTREATARLRGELSAAGFEVSTRARGGDPQRDVEDPGDDAAASVRLARNPQTHATEVWVSDRLTGKTLVRRIEVDPERSPRLAALRVVELLRASLLELASPPEDDAPPITPALAGPPPPEVMKLVASPAAVPSPEAASPPKRPRRWLARAAIEAGVAFLASADHLAPAAAPSVAVWVALPASFALRARFVGPVYQAGLADAAGTAVVHQELGTLDGAWIVPVAARWAPYVTAGGGPYHVHVQGAASSPYRGIASGAWSALVAAGVGLGWELAPAVSIAVEGEVVGLSPKPVVTIGGQPVASAGDPSLLASASLMASF